VEEGKSYQEIAELMRISKNTVKNQLVKAKQFLRDRVDLAAAL
jgi:RNA polymerase sigma-70 factor (ECF subfamily)